MVVDVVAVDLAGVLDSDFDEVEVVCVDVDSPELEPEPESELELLADVVVFASARLSLR